MSRENDEKEVQEIIGCIERLANRWSKKLTVKKRIVSDIEIEIKSAEGDDAIILPREFFEDDDD
jgi:hypothetical protein